MGAILTTAILVVNRAIAYEGYFRLAGAKATVAEALGLLSMYLLVLALPRLPIARYAILAGLAAAGIEIAHSVQERFLSLPGRSGGFVTLGFMLATFSCWGWTARRARLNGASFLAACGAAAMSAIVSMTITVCFGTIFEWYIAPIPIESMRGWAEFQRSGWSDLAAFSIAETIDSVTTHLLMAPIIALIFGAIAASFVVRRRRRA
jgi:hypothetical protein